MDHRVQSGDIVGQWRYLYDSNNFTLRVTSRHGNKKPVLRVRGRLLWGPTSLGPHGAYLCILGAPDRGEQARVLSFIGTRRSPMNDFFCSLRALLPSQRIVYRKQPPQEGKHITLIVFNPNSRFLKSSSVYINENVVSPIRVEPYSSGFYVKLSPQTRVVSSFNLDRCELISLSAPTFYEQLRPNPVLLDRSGNLFLSSAGVLLQDQCSVPGRPLLVDQSEGILVIVTDFMVLLYDTTQATLLYNLQNGPVPNAAPHPWQDLAAAASSLWAWRGIPNAPRIEAAVRLLTQLAKRAESDHVKTLIQQAAENLANYSSPTEASTAVNNLHELPPDSTPQELTALDRYLRSPERRRNAQLDDSMPCFVCGAMNPSDYLYCGGEDCGSPLGEFECKKCLMPLSYGGILSYFCACEYHPDMGLRRRDAAEDSEETGNG